jgi:hypothetical protein
MAAPRCVAGAICTSVIVGGDRFATDPATGHCYVSFDDEQLTFADAQLACVTLGGHLASITSAPEQALVASVQNTAQNPWIGLTDALVEGSFGWITGEARVHGLGAGSARRWRSRGLRQPVLDRGLALGHRRHLERHQLHVRRFHRRPDLRTRRVALRRRHPTGRGRRGLRRRQHGVQRRLLGDLPGRGRCGLQRHRPNHLQQAGDQRGRLRPAGTDNTGGLSVDIYNAGTASADVTNVALVLMNGGTLPAVEYSADGRPSSRPSASS